MFKPTVSWMNFAAVLAIFSASPCAFAVDEDLGIEPTVLLQPHKMLGGHAVMTTEGTADGARFNKPDALVEKLVTVAEAQQPRAAEIAKREKFWKQPVVVGVAQASNLLQFCSAYRGFEPSSEAADIVLEEKLTMKSRAAVELVKQKQHDDVHKAVVAATMQLAQGLGMPDGPKRNAVIQRGMQDLEYLVGKEKAHDTLVSMKEWSASVPPLTASECDPMSITQVQHCVDKITVDALKTDSVVTEVKNRLHKNNHHSKLMLSTAKVVNTSMSAIMFSPTIFSPAAQLTLCTFLAVSGGPEEAKLVKSLYLDRRLQTRYRMLTYEVTMDVNEYNNALMTHNSVLAAYCMNQAHHLGSDIHP